MDIDFYKTNTRLEFEFALKKLIKKGFSEKEAIELLETLYYAVANEYGE